MGALAAAKRKAHVVADVVAHAPTKSGADAQTLVGTVALAAAETVGSVSLTQDHADPVHFKYPDEHVLMLAFA